MSFYDEFNMLFVKVILILFGISLCVSEEDSQKVPFFRKDFKYFKEFNAFYKVHPLGKNWSDAMVTCQNEGAEMIVPATKEEFDAILDFSKQDFLWIGAHDIFSEGVFITIHGKPLSEYYVKWKPGEPNNVNNNENCLMMEKAGYNDLTCNHIRKYACKRSTFNLTQNEICETYDLDFTYSSDTDRCYKMHTTPLTWNQAFTSCISEESSLVVINSEAEAKILTKMFAQYPEKSLKGNFNKGAIHIGFNDLLSVGIYLNIDGVPLKESGYDNWSNGQPDNYQGKEHCGSMFRDGTLNDIECAQRAMFVCEKTLTTQNTPTKLSANVKLPDE